MADVAENDLFAGIGECLDELECEYLKVRVEHCKGLEDHSQLSSFLMLGIRSVCLLRGMLRLADPQVRRSFIESWQLQFEFKLRDSATKAQKWLEGQQEWQADRRKLEGLIAKLQGGPAGFAREFGELSEVAHPTLQAPINSVSIASTIAGVNPQPHRLQEEFDKLAHDYVGMVNREIWLTLQVCDEFIETSLKEERFSKCLTLHKNFLEGQNPPEQRNPAVG